MEGMEMVTKLLHLYSTSGNTPLLSFSPCASMLVPTMWNFSWRKKSSLDVTMFFLM